MELKLLNLLLFAIFISTVASSHEPSAPPPPAPCFPSIFSFGDSKADTGNQQAAFPFEDRAQFPPYGRTFFHKPVDRFCDGRLVIDFQAGAYGLPFLSPYLRGLGSDFRHGANFAASGVGALPNFTSSPFDLHRQFLQFRKLKAHYLEQLPGKDPINPVTAYIREGLYVISIGENDYRTGIRSLGLSVEQVKMVLIPRVIEVITLTLKGLYEEGARKFLVVGIAAEGCLPLFLTIFPATPQDFDSLGCLKPVNDYIKLHNQLLLQSVKQLRADYKDAEFAFADYYGINIEILSNAKKYGFENTLTACCGVGGDYNYNTAIQCGQSGLLNGDYVTAYSCPNPSSHVSWDGVHLTESFYKEVARAFVVEKYIDHPVALPQSCKLHYSVFFQSHFVEDQPVS